MAPGKRNQQSSPAQAPLTAYEKKRELNIARNNILYQSLGLQQLKAICNSGVKSSKASTSKKRDDAPEASGSVYEKESTDASTDSQSEASNAPSKKQEASSKRVVAPKHKPVPAATGRVTRQRTAAAISATDSQTPSTEGVLPSGSTPRLDLVPSSPQGDVTESREENQRGRSMGKGLERLSRGLHSKIPLHISAGNKRPAAPIEAAKFASEGGIALRQHIPIYTHWKKYSDEEIEDYKGKLGSQFTVDVKDDAVTEACIDLLKGGQRQMRFRLKRKYFTRVPADKVRTTSPVSSMTDEQWLQLVQLWSTPKHKETCEKNKNNRGKVMFPQCTGSRSYIAHAYVTRQEKFKDSMPTAIDFFKETHCSKKSGFSEPVQKAIADMEAIVAEPVQDGEQENTYTDALSQVLPKHSTFLQNLGLQTASRKRPRVASQVQDLEAQLENEKQEAAVLREKLQALQTQAEQSEKDRAKQAEEIESLKKTTEETNALLRKMFTFNSGQS